MEIRNIRHKALKAFVERGATKGLPASHVDKIRDIVAFLLDADAPDEVLKLARYQPHRLRGDRASTISLSVTANWRITFSYDSAAKEIVDLDLEDYH
jgi:proteic killer suppression protein